MSILLGVHPIDTLQKKYIQIANKIRDPNLCAPPPEIKELHLQVLRYQPDFFGVVQRTKTPNLDIGIRVLFFWVASTPKKVGVKGCFLDG